MELTALIPAAGIGERLGLGPKALLRLGDATVLEHVVRRMASVASRIIVGVPASMEPAFRELPLGGAHILTGGRTRQETIRILASAAPEGLCLIQDGARPFVSEALLQRVLASGRATGAAAAVLWHPAPCVTLRADGTVGAIVATRTTGTCQTPLCFNRQLLLEAYDRAGMEGREYSSTIELIAATGCPIAWVEGETRNFKITTQRDWELAQFQYAHADSAIAHDRNAGV